MCFVFTVRIQNGSVFGKGTISSMCKRVRQRKCKFMRKSGGQQNPHRGDLISVGFITIQRRHRQYPSEFNFEVLGWSLLFAPLLSNIGSQHMVHSCDKARTRNLWLHALAKWFFDFCWFFSFLRVCVQMCANCGGDVACFHSCSRCRCRRRRHHHLRSYIFPACFQMLWPSHSVNIDRFWLKWLTFYLVQ